MSCKRGGNPAPSYLCDLHLLSLEMTCRDGGNAFLSSLIDALLMGSSECRAEQLTPWESVGPPSVRRLCSTNRAPLCNNHSRPCSGVAWTRASGSARRRFLRSDRLQMCEIRFSLRDITAGQLGSQEIYVLSIPRVRYEQCLESRLPGRGRTHEHPSPNGGAYDTFFSDKRMG